MILAFLTSNFGRKLIILVIKIVILGKILVVIPRPRLTVFPRLWVGWTRNPRKFAGSWRRKFRNILNTLIVIVMVLLKMRAFLIKFLMIGGPKALAFIVAGRGRWFQRWSR